MIIAIDFDGTIVNDKYPEIGFVNPYARKVINQLHDEGHYIIIWTCRNGEHLTTAINFLLEQDIHFDRVNDQNPDNRKMYGDSTRKVYADIYIDDKNACGFPGWEEVYRWIRSSSPAVED